MTDQPAIPPPGRLSAAIPTYLRLYHRHGVRIDAPVPDMPVGDRLLACDAALDVRPRQSRGTYNPYP